MEITELEKRVEDKREQKAKKLKSIERHILKIPSRFHEEIRQMITLPAEAVHELRKKITKELEINFDSVSVEERRKILDSQYAVEDIYRLSGEIETIDGIISKYLTSIDKENNRLQLPEVLILREFINAWGERTKNWMKRMLELYIEYKKKYVEEQAEVKKQLKGTENYSYSGIQYEMRKRPIFSQVESIPQYIRSLTLYSPNERLKKIDKIVEEDKKAQYNFIITKTTEICGIITDADELRIASDGDINGVISGTKGIASIKTIGAGGYNENIIVNVKHGQRFHFRTLIRRVG